MGSKKDKKKKKKKLEKLKKKLKKELKKQEEQVSAEVKERLTATCFRYQFTDERMQKLPERAEQQEDWAIVPGMMWHIKGPSYYIKLRTFLDDHGIAMSDVRRAFSDDGIYNGGVIKARTEEVPPVEEPVAAPVEVSNEPDVENSLQILAVSDMTKIELNQSALACKPLQDALQEASTTADTTQDIETMQNSHAYISPQLVDENPADDEQHD